ncbi:MAG: D-alanyl-D-alanine carboxypeptidase/D-alanyl-D-alanine-endopeptidase [Cystobacterineae bacterium]|nr:D-alanyl-D-alanine carboxypeptidase/D-alanyl-D-alanine-endopeptidase [Cystobacterineae bacterium]
MLRNTLADAMEQSTLKSAHVSFQVISLDDKSTVFEYGAGDLLNPASNVKLFTSAAALSLLGPDYRFETEFFVDKAPQNGRVRTLFVRGNGDPSMTTERLYVVAAELSRQGLKEVQGNLVLDEANFDGERWAFGYGQEQGDKAYLAPTGALSLNWNAVAVYLRPGALRKQPAFVEIEPSSEYFRLQSKLQTGKATQRRFVVKSNLEAEKPHLKPHMRRQEIEVRGHVPVGKGTWVVWRRIDNPASYFGYTLKALLAKQGIHVRGKVVVGTVPPTAEFFYASSSESLDIILKRMNKQSSNFIAEQLLKVMGGVYRGLPASYAKGLDVVAEFLEKEIGIARGTYFMGNGSGLNDANRFSAAQTNQLLRYMFEEALFSPEFVSSLGIAAKDGTLRSRFGGSQAEGRLRAKTGTLETVSALSGYAQGMNGQRFVFSILVNDAPSRNAEVIQAIDALATVLTNVGQPPKPAVRVENGGIEAFKRQLKTYTALAKERKSQALLQKMLRAEPNPVARVLLADALYGLNPKDADIANAVVEALGAKAEILKPLNALSLQLAIPFPGLNGLIETAAAGSAEAIAKLLELAPLASTYSQLKTPLAEGLAAVAESAPEEMLAGLLQAPVADTHVTMKMLMLAFSTVGERGVGLYEALKAAAATKAEPREKVLSLLQMLDTLDKPPEGGVRQELVGDGDSGSRRIAPER